MILVALNVAVYLVQILIPGFTDSFVLSRGDLFVRPWTLLTSMFMHGSVVHILFNMYVLFIFGTLIEQRIGTRKFLVLYFSAGLLAAALSQFIYPAALGASGAIMGVIGTVIILFPRLPVLFFFFIPMPMWIAGIVIAGMDILGFFHPTGIANVAHLVGMATGLLYGLWLKRQNRSFHKRFGRKTTMNDADIEDYLRRGRI